jgi:hypothetical protein
LPGWPRAPAASKRISARAAGASTQRPEAVRPCHASTSRGRLASSISTIGASGDVRQPDALPEWDGTRRCGSYGTARRLLRPDACARRDGICTPGGRNRALEAGLQDRAWKPVALAQLARTASLAGRLDPPGRPIRRMRPIVMAGGSLHRALLRIARALPGRGSPRAGTHRRTPSKSHRRTPDPISTACPRSSPSQATADASPSSRSNRSI